MNRLDPRHSWIGTLIVAAATLAALLTLISPAASDGLGAPARLAFWVAHVAIPLALAQGLTQAAMRGAGMTGWSAIVTGGIAASVAFAPVAMAIDGLLLKEPFSWQALGGEIWALLLPVTLVWTALNGARFLRIDSDAAAQPKSPPVFADRLRPDRRGRVLALSSELHYLRVHTTRGDDLILCSLAQAMAELPRDAGLQTHRSHWVAFDAIDRIERAGSAGRAVLSNGIALPVARSRLSHVRAAV